MDSRTIFFWHLLILTTARNIPTNPPHIIFILADDLGWNDVSFHGSDQIPTPNIDALAYNGVILNNHYALPLCTPSRAALLTGKYPIHNGMQHNLILEPEPWGLPLDERLLPQYLDELGYTSHAIGKWHLGYFKKEYTPTHRGFTSHYGFWNGYQGYYNHFVQASFLPYEGYDMRRNMSVDWESFGRYSTDLFTDEAVRLIDEHDTEKGPLFLYLAHLAPHAGTYDAPLEAPAETIAQFRHIQDPSRRVYAAMVSKLDESVGLVVSALHKKGILDNSIIVFTSDNGAPTIGIHPNHGSNWPLRGMKNTPWDGGTRTVTCVWSRHLERPRRVSHQLMHISDWVPTLYSAAGGDATKLKHLDGVDMWEAISRDLPSPRKQLLINLDEATGYASMRIGDFKFVNGTTMLGYLDHWTGTPSEENENDISPQHEQLYRTQVLNSRVSRAIHGAVTSAAPQVAALRAAAKIHCGSHSHQEAPCDPLKRPCIYHMPSNACERGPTLEDARLMTMFKEAVEKYRSAAVPPVNQRTDRLANPKYWNNTWTNWRDFPSPTSELHEKGRGGFFF